MMLSEKEAYTALAHAIVIKAADDYRSIVSTLYELEERYQQLKERDFCTEKGRRAASEELFELSERIRSERGKRNVLRHFFRSGWYRTLTSVDGEFLFCEIEREEKKKWKSSPE